MRKGILLVLLFFLTGCVSHPTPVATSTVKPMPSQTSTVTVMPNLTKTVTPSPSSTMTALPTWTPLPTLSSKDGLEALYGWLKGSVSCNFPCWAGITPGETTWAEARQLLEPTSGFAELDVYLDTICTLDNCNGMDLTLPYPTHAQISIEGLLLRDEIHLIRMEIGGAYFAKALELNNILNRYGKPAILKFYADPDQPGQYKELQLTMVYPEHQFVIKYANIARVVGENLVSCGTDSVINLLILDNKEQMMSESAIENSVETKNFPVTAAWLKSADESIGMTVDEFYETFKKAGAPCITTPVEIWMP